MTTARLKYRNYVPYNWIAIEFCNVKFFGNNSDSFDREWDNIRYEKYRKCRANIDALSKNCSLIERQQNSILSELNGLQKEKPWWRIWKTDYEKELIKKVSHMYSNIEKIRLDIERAEANRIYSAQTLVRKAERMLSQNGFVLKSSNTEGTECVTYTDIWELA